MKSLPEKLSELAGLEIQYQLSKFKANTQSVERYGTTVFQPSTIRFLKTFDAVQKRTAKSKLTF